MRAASEWQMVASDQPRLHDILRRTPELEARVAHVPREILNQNDATFVRQILRANAPTIADRTRIIIEQTNALLTGEDMSAYEITPDGSENFSDGFRTRLQALNQAVLDSGVKLKGNLCFHHHAALKADSPPDPSRAHKRRNYRLALRYKRPVLEIGFNAGHSALLALSLDPEIRFTAIDIGRNAYTTKCAQAVKSMFGDRFAIHIGDSRDVLAALAMRPNDFDVFHVDGGHGVENCRTDISNCIRLADQRRGRSHLLLDDTADQRIFDVHLEFIAAGRLATESFGNRWEGHENLYAAIV